MARMNEPSGAIKGRNPLSDQAMPPFAENEVSEAAVWIEADKYIPKKSCPSIAGPGADREISGLKIQSDLERLSGIVVHGDAWEPASYTVRDSKIELSGYGVSDFTSRGAGALVYGGGELILDNVDIITRGSGRSATIATERGTLRVKNSRLASHGGPLPPDYEPVIGPGMMEPPWPLGLEGNTRTHLSMDGSRTFFDNCELYGAGWAVLSTDSSGGCLYLEASDCKLEMSGNGYITYADNGCHNVFNRCSASTGNMFAIIDGNASVTAKDTAAICMKNAFVLHGALPEWIDVNILDIEGGSFRASENVIFAKSANADIYVKGAALLAEHGAILRSVCNDDPMYYKMAAKGPDCYGVQATFEDMIIDGDILHEDTDRKMRISLADTVLTGRLTGNPVLNLYGGSRWTATDDSVVTVETDTDSSCFDAPAGVTITVTAAGSCRLAGEYTLAGGGRLRVQINDT